MSLHKLFGLARACLIALCACALTAAAAPHKLMSISYNPSGVADFAQREKGFTEAQLRADLKHLAPYTTRIRTYSLDYGLERVPTIARELGLKVSLGVWLGPDHDKNERQFAEAIHVALGNADVVDRVYVGNEAIVRGDLMAEEVIPYIGRMKDAVAGRKIQVSTAEPWHVWLKNPHLAAASDFIGVHIFGYHDGPPESAGVDYLVQRVQELHAAFPDKRVFIAETGWPHAGPVIQAAQPSAAAQAEYLAAFLRRAAKEGYDYNIVEAFDQPWKAPEEHGALWGMFTDKGRPKFAFQAP
jgi:exo-beta-1,3-glucanase (GH17 family)